LNRSTCLIADDPAKRQTRLTKKLTVKGGSAAQQSASSEFRGVEATKWPEGPRDPVAQMSAEAMKIGDGWRADEQSKTCVLTNNSEFCASTDRLSVAVDKLSEES
jgi:hypothetical protein